MQKLLAVFWGLGTAAAAGLPQSAETVQVLVFDYAGVSGGALSRAQEEAASVYGRIGVRLKWVLCKNSPAEPAKGGICAAPRTLRSPELRLLSGPMARRVSMNTSACGFTLFTLDDGRPVFANVFAQRAEEIATFHDLGYGIVLGHLIAHELGHILLGIGNHSPHGLMSMPWGRRELRWAAKGSLSFTPAQAARIRMRLAEPVRGPLVD